MPILPLMTPLLKLIEQRFGISIDSSSVKHLQHVVEHYDAKRRLLKAKYGEEVYTENNYAKAFLISETARMMLREIDPWPRRKKPSKGKPSQ